MSVLIYGAYGYSGQLISQEAKQQGLDVVLAGRDEAALSETAHKLKLPHLTFSLKDKQALHLALSKVSLVIHCAGPFSSTAKPMIEACIATKTHYLDITGEVEVFEYAHSSDVDQRATEAGIIVCPGVGFDVIPTDCVASALKAALPDASHLTLAFQGGSAISPGTAKTMVESLGKGVMIRRNGRIKEATLKEKSINFGSGDKTCMGISWGDVSTAYHSTGIPNVEVYVPASSKVIQKMKLLRFGRWIFKPKFIQRLIQSQIESKVTGPDANVRSANPATIYGEARNEWGKTVQARLKTLNGYEVTKYGAVHLAKHILTSDPVKRGSTTPSLLLGASLISELPGSSPITLFEH
ncbi:saccharopine dehydrogenase family protein [Litoribrevibacter albus]|uniref:Membrane protein n=1 Tax=Litoribrevibacter albus TaxID=1473156 RepID=A0AA37SAJ3_9GAMM|nr:saccharopine dehydrogenase NADP-binding domain-containing protein [Litoribrevibacter albus]GLQ31809.1 membrane protein [Litoribrevibacter albus]